MGPKDWGKKHSLQHETWRVHVIRTNEDGSRSITHDSYFPNEQRARDYFVSVEIGGSTKTLELRASGQARYRAVETIIMTGGSQ